MSSSVAVPTAESSIKEMKAYLDAYGVSYADCVEKAEIIARVEQTVADPNKKAKATASSGSSSADAVGSEIVNLLGSKLQAKSGKFNTSSLQAKIIALYFSAHWCPPCRQFTPVLKQLYTDKLKAEGVEVVFVSSDQNDGEFKKYFGEMPWLALPFEQRQEKENISSLFGVEGIPSLVVLRAQDGKVLSEDGRTDVMRHKAAVGQHWIKLAQK